jgi:hypothetical protein
MGYFRNNQAWFVSHCAEAGFAPARTNVTASVEKTARPEDRDHVSLIAITTNLLLSNRDTPLAPLPQVAIEPTAVR